MRTTLLFFMFAAWLPAAANRLVSTAPGLTEILFALGLGERVVGVSEYCRFPDEATKKPKVGSFLQPNLEVIASLRPDVVFIQTNPVQLRQKLERLGLRVEEVNLDSMEGILAAIPRVAEVAGVEARGKQLSQSLRKRLEDLKGLAKTGKRVAFLVGRTPGRLEGMVAVGPGSYLDALLTAAGGENVFRDAKTMYPQISIEQLLARQPDVILEMGDAVHDGVQDQNAQNKYRENVLAVWSRLPSLEAVKKGRIYPLTNSVYVVPGPRFVQAAESFRKLLEGAP
ncbi:MAG: helical backbone metal receptor [Bryobacter sp.]|nr:helical backbone metal receptor [Bryobacter sp.]